MNKNSVAVSHCAEVVTVKCVYLLESFGLISGLWLSLLAVNALTIICYYLNTFKTTTNVHIFFIIIKFTSASRGAS